MFARICLGVSFIHGIGGGIYDEVTNDIVETWLGLKPPGIIVTSGTLRLPLPRYPTSFANPDRLIRDLIWNPQRHLSEEAARNPEVQELVKRKQKLIESEPEGKRQRKEWFQQLQGVTEALRPGVAEQLPFAKEAVARNQREEHANEVVMRRDFAWLLYPEETLREWLGSDKAGRKSEFEDGKQVSLDNSDNLPAPARRGKQFGKTSLPTTSIQEHLDPHVLAVLGSWPDYIQQRVHSPAFVKAVAKGLNAVPGWAHKKLAGSKRIVLDRTILTALPRLLHEPPPYGNPPRTWHEVPAVCHGASGTIVFARHFAESDDPRATIFNTPPEMSTWYVLKEVGHALDLIHAEPVAYRFRFPGILRGRKCGDCIPK